MGLEMVEIVIDVEKKFGISLPDSRAADIHTVADLRDCVEEIFGYENEGVPLIDEITARLHRAVQSIMPEKTNQPTINAETLLPNIFPLLGRRITWRRLANALDMPLPPLERPHLISTIVLVVAIVLGHITGLLAIQSIFSHEVDHSGWIVGSVGVFFAFTAIFIWWFIGRILTKPFERYWPKKIRTIGDLSKYLMENTYGKVVKKEQRFNREEVWCILQSIIASSLCINRCEVKPESRFYEDLGAG